ncbi:MAG: DinB family protein [Gammaproteobacteria bacterium]
MSTNLKSSFLLMAQYNQWMNQSVYEAAARLPEESLAEDRGAFFSSILGTLNHILVGDTLWLKRFATHPRQYRALTPVKTVANPTSLDQILYSNLSDLSAARLELDAVIVEWCQEIDEKDLSTALDYANTKGQRHVKHFASLIQHFFNHQTHHRGQASTLLHQAGVSVGVTDLLALIPNVDGVDI